MKGKFHPQAAILHNHLATLDMLQEISRKYKLSFVSEMNIGFLVSSVIRGS